MDDLFSHLERELSEPVLERTPSAFWRCVVRPKLFRRTVTTHNGELGSVLRFPWGVSWRKAQGLEWCPICLSASPMEILRRMSQTKTWSPVSSITEFHKLVERGEMDPSSTRFDLYEPMHGTGFVYYTFDGFNEPVAFTFVEGGKRPLMVSMKHMGDLNKFALAYAIQHLNRFSPVVSWSIDAEGRLSWSLVAFASNVMLASEVDGIDEDDDEPVVIIDDTDGETDHDLDEPDSSE